MRFLSFGEGLVVSDGCRALVLKFDGSGQRLRGLIYTVPLQLVDFAQNRAGLRVNGDGGFGRGFGRLGRSGMTGGVLGASGGGLRLWFAGAFSFGLIIRRIISAYNTEPFFCELL